MGPWTPRGPQSDSLGVFFIFCKPGIRVKAACRTKRGPSQNFKTLFLSFSDPFSSGMGSLMLLGALKHELGPLISKMGPLSVIFFVIFYFYFFLVRDFGPLPKNSGQNPMSFYFLVGGYLGAPMIVGLTPWGNPGYATEL